MLSYFAGEVAAREAIEQYGRHRQHPRVEIILANVIFTSCKTANGECESYKIRSNPFNPLTGFPSRW